MISVFLRSAVFFFPKCKAGERAHGDVTRGAGAAFNCGVSFSSPGMSRYPADQIALSLRYENTLCENSANLRAPREIAPSSPRTSRSLDQRHRIRKWVPRLANRDSLNGSFFSLLPSTFCLFIASEDAVYTHTYFILNVKMCVRKRSWSLSLLILIAQLYQICFLFS